MLVADIHQREQHSETLTDKDLAKSCYVAKGAITGQTVERYVVSIAAKLGHLFFPLIRSLRLRCVIIVDAEWL